MFVSTLPYRVELDSHWLFDEVVRYVQEKCLSILEHSHYPLQHILADLHVTQSNVSFLESMFDFITISNEGNDLSLNGVNLEQVSLNDSYVMAKFDFSLRFVYNPSSDNNQLSCYFVCSRDLFDETTLAIIDRRFQHVLEQLFSSKSSTKCIDLYCTSISKFDLILSEEVEERQAIIFHRLENIINETPASFAQCRIWSENQGDIDTDQLSLTIHNMSFFYRLCTGDVLSVKQLRHALQLIVTKHESLHTALIYDSKDNQLMQRVLTQQDINNDMFTITESTYETDEQLNAIMGNEKCDPQLFDLAQGPVFRCHIIYYKQISSNNILSHKDIIIFSFHRAFFDYLSMNIFLHDLDQAYKTDQLTADDVTTLRYIDYAVIERQTSMTGASMYWLDTLYAYHLGQSLSLPYDRYRLTNEHRTNRATSISFDFGQDVSQHFLTYASSNNIKHQHLALAIYFIFLLKLTNGEQDLCIGMNIDNRYRDELKSIIGMFENIIPLRCQLDPHWSFQYLLDYVREITTNSMKYSYFPLQRILNQHPNVSKPAFLDISFEFLSSMTRRDNQLIMIDDSQLSSIPSTMNINDFSLIIQHDLNVGQLSCTINASLDLFNVETIDKISQRFHSILNQLFTFVDNQMNKSIYEISLTLPNERLLMQSMNNTQVSFPTSATCIHHEFVYQVMKHPQKLAVELDEQSLTYAELLHYVQVLSLHLINKYAVVPGEIICQCVERSLSMVIGIMAIEMVGGVYCPLSPRDPQHRLHALIQQTQSRLVLVHWLTKMKFNNDIVLIDTHSVLFHNDVQNDVNRLSSITVTSNNIAYIIFTSGSTGVPKAVKVRHMNFAGCIYSLVGSNTLNKHDTVVQMARCSFDLQLQEILGSLMIGVTVVLLHPKGTVDFDYLCHILHTKEVTYMQSVPSLLQSFFIFLEQCDKANAIKYLRSICCAGEPFSVKFRTFIAKIDIPHCTVWNLYGSTETTLVSTHHLVDIKSTSASIPVGRSLPNYQSLLLNKFLQSTCISQIGELFIGGVGVFAGYLGRDDLTAKALIEIDGNLFYRISDIVQMDENGLLHYHGRKDHQIKLHGQRIELCEIEQCLLTIPSISACVVIKWSDDHLVVYVQSSYIDENLLREHCQAHLPPHMIPSLFIILVKFPLNANGKIDRKLLPPPSFSLMHCTNDGELLVPINEYEIIIHHIWCNILKQKQISTNTNIFTLGGHSLVIMQLFHRYKTEFNLEIKTLSITKLFEHPTIIDHAQLIYQTISAKENINDYHWSSLHIIEAKASFAQERIFLDEQIRFSSTDNNTNNMYVIPLIYRISSMNDHISISQLQHTFQSIIRKHQILRTALYLDTNGTIIQHCLDTNAIIYDEKASRFSIINLRDEEHEQNETVKKILNQSDLFGLSKGHVINCHILRQDQSNDSCTQNNGDLLTKDDLILFTIHHAMFDGASRSIFIRELSLAYQSIDLLPIDDNSFQYIDYSIHEHIMDMTLSREFWQLELKGYNLTRQLSLPVDRQRSTTNQQRSGLASAAEITFDNEICTLFLNYASSHHLTLFQLGLSIFYVFLFKLTHGETDLCISSINANRYRSELVNMIGMFVSTLPYRVELDRHWSFDEVVRYVQEKCLSILEHSHYPLQHILGDLHLTQSNVSFLETMFDFITISEDASGLCLNGVNLEQVLLDDSYEMAKFDFSLRFLYNSSSDDNQLSCSFICSRDLFGGTTVAMIGRRFKYLCEQIFAPASFAQSRIWSENQRHTNTDQSSLTIHNMSFFYRLYTGDILSVKQLRHALQLIVTKHESLHTLLIYDSNKNILMQRILTQQDINNDMVTITESSYETDEQLNAIIENEKCNPQLFDLTQALVFRCHIIYYKQISSNNILSDRDIIIFNFHPALFDYPSINLFLYDLDQAYKTGQLTSHNATTLRYIDYAIVEQEMSMTGASMFWHDILHDCKLDQYLLLPYDRYRLSNEHRTGRGTSISFDFGPNLSQYFLTCASANSISLEHLALATYYVFLFKLTNGEKDLCIGMTVDNRYRDELKSIIGLFENIIPLRCQLDPQWSFHKLLEYVQEFVTKSMKYSYFPLQRILDQHSNITNPAFLNISFKFISTTIKDDKNKITLNDHQLSLLPFSPNITENEIMSKYDFIASFQYNMDVNALSCTINASLDIFNVETIDNISQRFHLMLNQLFASADNQMNKPLYEISLTLPNERLLMQSMNNTQVSFSSPLTCIHHEFVCQVMKHPQKLAVELDDQSLTYCELLHYVQILSLTLLDDYLIAPGEIICQCVERSLSMVVGILSIAMVGSAYCPLSLRDPPERLQALVNQSQSRLVLVHASTPAVFSPDNITLNIDSIIRFEERSSAINLNELSDIAVTPESVVFVIFTSGSTGIPKAVQLRHRNFTEFMHSFVNIDVVTKSDIVIQMARCSFDNHLLSLVGTLIIGSTLVMLRPEGNMDLEYLAGVLDQKQITVMHAVPSLLNSLFEFLRISKRTSAVKYLRSLCSGGEAVNIKQVSLFQNVVGEQCLIRNHYGPAEITINCTCYSIKLSKSQTDIPIGQLLPNYQCLILDEFLQFVCIGHEGELLVSGVGIFAGYFNRDDLTAKAVININEVMYYKTGDLVRMDNNGLLHYQGRKDHQIKLHGQRIELGEIERCLLSITSISACVVVKWGDDHLVAYVQSFHINEEELRHHCQSHLPPHMIPSIFIILDRLPLNPNGKIDRKLLPSPHFSSTHLTNNIELLLPTNDIEVTIHHIWCEIFNQNQISIDTNIFTIGGHSLLMMQLLHRYKIEFHLETNILSISNLFQHPTIIDHAQLIYQTINVKENINDYHWSSLHLTQARASFAQERIYLDEQIRFSSNKTTMNNMYVIPLLYRISSMNDHISITRLFHAFQSVITKHNILRIALYIDDTNGNITQHCLDANVILNDDIKSYSLTIVNIHNDDHRHMNEIIEEILNQSDLFDLSKGRVIRCHILRHYHPSQDSISCENDDLLTENDHILISIHHAMFDGASTSIFIRDLSLAYQSNDSLSMDENTLNYIDYSIHEHLMDMTLSQEFWLLQLKGCNLARQLSLPVDRQRSSTNQQRSGLASIAEITFDNELCTSFLNYASSHHLTYFQLGLSIFYVFLFKLTHGETDLCISSINANRYRSELVNMIGMFVSTLPFRVELDPGWSFNEVVKYVQEKCLSILEHSHYPLQHILGDNLLNQSSVSFLETMFDFISVSKDVEHLCLNNTNLEQMSLKQSTEVSKFDFALTFVYNPLSDNKRLSYRFICSHDLFEKSTVSQITQRFQYMFEQVFQTQSSNIPVMNVTSSINKVSLILPEEAQEMELAVFHRLDKIVNEGMIIHFSFNCGPK
ncbi:unnamed protein product [Adineta steineri]|uniref:Carrier domain-containing protein n=2 Tax=Adineta steineri TaxID=433720 RepID=A0A814BZU6_9BILA|nr:unnamed protein product [Adineta steineri]